MGRAGEPPDLPITALRRRSLWGSGPLRPQYPSYDIDSGIACKKRRPDASLQSGSHLSSWMSGRR